MNKTNPPTPRSTPPPTPPPKRSPKAGRTAAEFRESLNGSTARRRAMLARFGMIPMSVLRLTRGALSASMFLYQSEHVVPERNLQTWKTLERPTEHGDTSRRLRVANKMIGGVVAAMQNRPQASIMAAELVDFFIKYYAAPGQVYLDPFMGQGVQLQVAALRGLHYWGFDLSTEFYHYIQQMIPKLHATTEIHTFHADSRDPSAIPDGIGDFSFHSPPYWDVEYYGDEPGQLGTGQTYADFLLGMEAVMRAWLPKFKPGAWHVVNVNDLRRDGVFYPYHADTIALMQRAGWRLHDIWIIDGLVGGLPRAFAVDFNLRRIAPKLHEYALVFRR